jgi:hypothetical protein
MSNNTNSVAEMQIETRLFIDIMKSIGRKYRYVGVIYEDDFQPIKIHGVRVG